MTVRHAKPLTYVRAARRLLARGPASVVSAGQVAWHAHRRSARASDHDIAADQALACCAEFERANFINSNRLGITLWRARALP